MNTEIEQINNEQECVNNGVLVSSTEYQDVECKLEVDSAGEEEQDPIGDSQEKEISVKEETSDGTETTADESMAVEALRQLGGMFSISTTPMPLPPPPAVDLPPPFETPVSQFRQHICDICGDTFERKSDLVNHIVCHQVDRPHACRICGNLFRRKADLQNHMICHQVRRPHRCSQCGADFQRPSSLTNHIKIHTYSPGRALMASDASNPNLQNATNITITASANETPMTHIPSYNGWDISSTNNVLESSNCEPLSTESNMANEDNSGQVIEAVVEQTQEITELCNMNSNENVIQPLNEEQNDNSITPNFELGVKQENAPFVPNTNETITDQQAEQSKSSNNTNRRPHVCRHCGLSFSREKALKCHARLHQDYWGSPVECDRCEEMFPEEVSLQDHQQSCNGSRRRQNPPHHIARAEQIDYEAQQPKAPRQTGKHACVQCEKRFTTKQKLYRHMWIHRKTPFVCEICGISVCDRATLDEHRRDIHLGESPYRCNECGKAFASRQGLWEHGRIHASSLVTHASPFICQRCGKTFASRQGHLIHMRTHTGERPYGCRFCWKAFRDGGTLRKHERIHTGERPHVCPLCPRAFNQKVVLREHVRWVHAARNTDGCRICGYVVADREALCAHIVKHSDQLAAIAKAAKKKQGTEVAVEKEVITVDPIPSTSFSSPQIETVESNVNDEENLQVKSEYTCDMCGDVFSQRTELVNHVRIHI